MANTYLPSTLNPERVVTSCAIFADLPVSAFFLSSFLAKFHALTILKLHTQINYKFHSCTSPCRPLCGGFFIHCIPVS